MDWFIPSDNTYTLSQWLFLRSIGVIYLIAFWSLQSQIIALFGKNGISPISKLLKKSSFFAGKNHFFQLPTLFWFNSSDCFIKSTPILGIISSFLIIIDFATPFFLMLVWILYLSFHSVGSDFLSYQWDTLLLETGFISIFLSLQTAPPAPIIFLLWILLFRFMFSSGIVKYLHGSHHWRDLTAMQVHYETQPLPTRIGYYLHLQPLWLAKLSTLGVYFIEIIVPFSIFSPPTLRMLAFAIFVSFQIFIMLTGNYTFFNLLTIVLCIPLIPDSYLSPFLWEPRITESSPTLTFFISTVAYMLICLNLLNIAQIFIPLRAFRFINRYQIPFRLVNSYALFVHMTQNRDEIIIQGSEDGENWKTYEFKWKPGDPKKAPKWNIPHQPRLDWQMWFAALSNYRQNQWFINLLILLLERSKEIENLLEVNPFKENPPKHIQALVYRYHFSSLKTKKETGQWWKREYKGHYCPPIRKKL